ncbi:MAG: class I SAM-dependent methyltransferase [Patescibacteria group bacterium]
MTKKPQIQTWKQMASVWKKYIKPPARPSSSQIEIWQKIIKQKVKEKSKVLILGATPESRDICTKYHLETIVCDISQDMIKAMDEIVKHKNPKEKKVICNWLEMKFKKESFDLILSDASLNQLLSKNDLKKLLSKLQDLLKPDGYILLREVTRANLKPEIKGEKWIKWFEKYRKKKISKTELYMYLKYLSDANPFPKSPSIVDWAPVFKKMAPLYKQAKVPKDFYRWCEKVFGSKQHKRLLIFLKKDLEKLLKQYFRLLPIKQCHDCSFDQYMPCYLGRPKKQKSKKQ